MVVHQKIFPYLISLFHTAIHHSNPLFRAFYHRKKRHRDSCFIAKEKLHSNRALLTAHFIYRYPLHDLLVAFILFRTQRDRQTEKYCTRAKEFSNKVNRIIMRAVEK